MNKMSASSIKDKVTTGIPVNFYSIIPKIILLSVLFLFLIENRFLALGVGFLSGTILHLAVSYYDCIVQIENNRLTLFYLRPFAYKEEFNLLKMDKVEIIKENKVKTVRDAWVIADGIGQFTYDKLIFKRQNFILQAKFRTKESDLPKLEAAINAILNPEKQN